jgi:hypothetical protein
MGYSKKLEGKLQLQLKDIPDGRAKLSFCDYPHVKGVRESFHIDICKLRFS